MTKLTPEDFAVTPYDTADFLETPEDVYYFLNEVLADGDPELIASALGDIARSKGMTKIAKKTKLSRTNLYRSLSKKGDPQLSTVSKLIKSFGFTLVALPSAQYNNDPEVLMTALRQGVTSRSVPTP